MDAKQSIIENKTALGIELGSTRIKAVLIDGSYAPIAAGGYDWENRFEEMSLGKAGNKMSGHTALMTCGRVCRSVLKTWRLM